MNVVQTVGALTQEASGPTYSVVRLCESLIARGQNVTLLSLDWAPGSTVPAFGKTFPMACGPRRVGRSPPMLRWLDSQARDGAADLIHAHGLWLMMNVYPGWVARRHKLPLVVSPRGTFTRYAMASGSPFKRIFWPLVQRPALAPVMCFHATAEAEHQDIRRLGFRQPVAVIPNGIDLPRLTARRPGARRILLFLGRIHPNKGLDVLLPAWAQVQNRFSNWELRIVGDDHGYNGVSGYLDQMKTLARDLRLERVWFDGPRYGAEKLNIFRNADLYVLPSYSENFGMTVAEALSQETPAIVAKGAPWEGLERNGAGWWIDIGVESLVACLEGAMAQPRAQLAAMGTSGRRWMKRNFLWPDIARKMIQVYQWLLNPAMAPPACVIGE